MFAPLLQSRSIINVITAVGTGGKVDRIMCVNWRNTCEYNGDMNSEIAQQCTSVVNA